jgi:hypothetical protein
MLLARRNGLPFASASRASTKGSPSVAEESVCEPLAALVGAVRGRAPAIARVARPGVSSITVTSVTGSEISVRPDEPEGAETMRCVDVARESRGWRTAMLAVVDGPGSALLFCVSLVALSSNCGRGA